MENTSSIATLKKGKEAFRQYLDNEKNPVKHEQLKEYIPYIDKAYDLRELSWFFQKALENANAQQAFLAYQNTVEEFKHKQKRTWKIRLIFLWAVLILASTFVIWKGFQPFYVYTMSDGTAITSDVYEGKHLAVSEGAELLEFSHQKFEFTDHAFIRALGVLLSVVSLSVFSHIKLQ